MTAGGQPCVPPRLLRAYRRTRYCAPGDVVRIGRRSPALDLLLRHRRAPCVVFITAWNPFSRPMPEGWNRRMQQRLAERLRRRSVLPACGVLGRWREDHLLVLAPLPCMLRLGRVFRQNALVAIRRGGAARLWLIARAG